MKKEVENLAETSAKSNRRVFLGNLGKAGITAAAAVAAAPLLDGKSTVVAQIGRGTSVYQKRAAACFQVRMDAAQANFQPLPPLFSRPTNGDEDLYENNEGVGTKVISDDIRSISLEHIRPFLKNINKRC